MKLSQCAIISICLSFLSIAGWNSQSLASPPLPPQVSYNLAQLRATLQKYSPKDTDSSTSILIATFYIDIFGKNTVETKAQDVQTAAKELREGFEIAREMYRDPGANGLRSLNDTQLTRLRSILPKIEALYRSNPNSDALRHIRAWSLLQIGEKKKALEEYRIFALSRYQQDPPPAHLGWPPEDNCLQVLKRNLSQEDFDSFNRGFQEGRRTIANKALRETEDRKAELIRHNAPITCHSPHADVSALDPEQSRLSKLSNVKYIEALGLLLANSTPTSDLKPFVFQLSDEQKSQRVVQLKPVHPAFDCLVVYWDPNNPTLLSKIELQGNVEVTELAERLGPFGPGVTDTMDSGPQLYTSEKILRIGRADVRVAYRGDSTQANNVYLTFQEDESSTKAKVSQTANKTSLAYPSLAGSPYFYLFLLLILALVGALLLLQQNKKKTQDTSFIHHGWIRFSILVLYPGLCVSIAAVTTFRFIMAEPQMRHIIAAFFGAGLTAGIALATTLFAVVLALFFIRINIKILAFVPLLANLIFCFVAFPATQAVLQAYNKGFVQPRIEEDKRKYASEVRTWPRKLDFEKLPPQLEIKWVSRNEFVLTNRFPVKIYARLQAQNPIPYSGPAKDFRADLETCEIIYDTPLAAGESLSAHTDKCLFDVPVSSIKIFIRTDIGYSAASS